MGGAPATLLISESVFCTVLGALLVGRCVRRNLPCRCLHRNSLLSPNFVIIFSRMKMGFEEVTLGKGAQKLEKLNT